MTKIIINKYILFLFFILFFSSCKVKLNILNTKTDELIINKLLNNVENNYIKYDNLSVKISAKIDINDKSNLIHGFYRIKRDSIIWITVGPSIGVELFRAVLYHDSLKFIDRFNKLYYNGDYSILNKIANTKLDYNIIQNILTNQLIFEEKNIQKSVNAISQNYNYNIEKDCYKLVKTIKTGSKITDNKFVNYLDSLIIVPQIYKIEKLNLSDTLNNRNMEIWFSNFKKIDTTYFPNKINIIIKSDQKKLKIFIKIKQINIKKKNRFPWKTPPKKYSIIY